MARSLSPFPCSCCEKRMQSPAPLSDPALRKGQDVARKVFSALAVIAWHRLCSDAAHALFRWIARRRRVRVQRQQVERARHRRKELLAATRPEGCAFDRATAGCIGGAQAHGHVSIVVLWWPEQLGTLSIRR
jgi:hypothetical protein